MSSASSLDAPAGIRSASRYFPELESLRGIAILLVYVYHVRAQLWPFFRVQGTVVSPLEAFMYGGHTGVSLFFVLSGFLLSLPFLDEAAGGRHVDRRRYFERRALRILPLYYLVVIVGAVVTAKHVTDVARALPYLVFANSVHGWYTPIRRFTSATWSLATEVQFYLVLPFLPLLLRSPRGRRIGVVLLVAYVAAYVGFLAQVVQLPSVATTLRLGNSVFGRGWLFLGGILAAWIYRTHGDRLRAAMAGSRLFRNGGADVVLLAVLAAVGLLLRWVVAGVSFHMEAPRVHAWHVAEGVLWTSVLLLLLLAPLRTKPLWCNRVLAHIGILSYSIYLWHLPVMLPTIEYLRPYIQASVPQAFAWMTLLSVVFLGLCELSYRWIERPFLERKARLAA